jgi:hypothetical protein
MRRYKAKVSATVELVVWLKENDNGEIEIDEVDEVLEVDEYENIREI